jgi:hypothetical protein
MRCLFPIILMAAALLPAQAAAQKIHVDYEHGNDTNSESNPDLFIGYQTVLTQQQLVRGGGMVLAGVRVGRLLHLDHNEQHHQ